jgi:hypothetical protein
MKKVKSIFDDYIYFEIIIYFYQNWKDLNLMKFNNVFYLKIKN